MAMPHAIIQSTRTVGHIRKCLAKKISVCSFLSSNSTQWVWLGIKGGTLLSLKIENTKDPTQDKFDNHRSEPPHRSAELRVFILQAHEIDWLINNRCYGISGISTTTVHVPLVSCGRHI